VTTIDYPSASGTFAFGINDRREIIGIYADTTHAQHAFLPGNGVFTNIDLAGGVTTPFSINDLREIVGQFEDVPNTTGHGYPELKNGKFTTYDVPQAPPNSTFLISINNFQQIVGWIDTQNGFHNFLLTEGEYRDFDLPKAFQPSQVSAQTINDSGDTVGFFTDSQGLQHGFIATREVDDNSGRKAESTERARNAQTAPAS
jgi:probable HAF family extracellular repeat protein